jgi:hypothetical protein
MTRRQFEAWWSSALRCLQACLPALAVRLPVHPSGVHRGNVNTPVRRPTPSLIGLAIMAAGTPVYFFLWRH